MKLFYMPAERGYDLQISLGKTRSDPTCVHGLVTSNVAAKDHVTPCGAWLDCTAKLLAKFASNDCEKMITTVVFVRRIAPLANVTRSCTIAT